MADYPEELKYTAEHEWVKQADSSAGAGVDGVVVRVGITSYAQDALGDIVFVSLPAAGTSVSAGDALGEVESTKSVSDVYAPLDGEVVARNEELSSTPELINSDPYGAGWLVEIRITEPAALDALLDAQGYASHVSAH
ncbi:MAG TPA: glycine cleavage system protein GcvH [Frankiaceae bacterium]|jgi:glycine cleavage system H protein|nr:glycine cleavage system protein GcvH [Frankiaceae bacterium]